MNKLEIIKINNEWCIKNNLNILKTYKNNDIILPSKLLAKEVLREINHYGKKVCFNNKSLTYYSFYIIDTSSLHKREIENKIISFLETDTICYRDQSKSELYSTQKIKWDPLLRIVEKELGLIFTTKEGIMPFMQSKLTKDKLATLISEQNIFVLTSIFHLALLSHSIVIPLVLLLGSINLIQAWEAFMLEQNYNIEIWGESDLMEKERLDKWKILNSIVRHIDILCLKLNSSSLKVYK